MGKVLKRALLTTASLLFFSTVFTNLIPLQIEKLAFASAGLEIYVASWCPHCQRLEKFLKNEGISYRRYDIDDNAAGKKAYHQLGAPGIPVIKLGSEVIVGFDENAVRQMLQRSRPSVKSERS